MKFKLYTFAWLLACGSIITSCDNALDGNFPEDYASVVHFKGVEDEPETEMKILLTGEDVVYEIELGKGGNNPKAEANVELKVMTEEELKTYNEEWNTNYSLLPSEYYSFSETSIKFGPEENVKKVQILFKGDVIKNLANDETQYVIPINLVSEDNRIHQGLNQSILKLEITVPTIKIDMPELQIFEKSLYDSEEDKKIDIPVTAIVDLLENKWNFNATIVNETEELQELVDEYKTTHPEASEYELMPAENYSLPEKLSFDNSLLSDGIISIDANGILEEKNYILPVKLKECIEKPFNVDDKVFYIHLYVKDKLSELEIDENNILTTSFPYETTEPDRSPSSLFDKKEGTLWKSRWSGNGATIKDPKYGVWLDINLEKGIRYFSLEYLTQNNYVRCNPKVIELYAYNDNLGQDVKAFARLENLPEKEFTLYSSKNFDLGANYSKIRIAIVESQEKKLTPAAPGGEIRGWTGMAELIIRGK